MAPERIAAVVEVERMRGDAIDQGGAERIEMPTVAEDQRRPRRSRVAQSPRDDGRRLLLRARQGDADRVEHGKLCRLDRLARKLLESQLANSIGERAQEHEIRRTEENWNEQRAPPERRPVTTVDSGVRAV